MKKVRILIALVLALTFAAIPAACKKKTVDTFTGAISEATYESSEAAVLGFLDEEISGMMTTAVYKSYKKEKDLSAAEIAELVGDGEKPISAEKGTVEYEDIEIEPEYGGDPAAPAALAEEPDDGTEEPAPSGETVQRTLYLLRYDDAYRYFAPVVENGDSLTASYFASVFDPKKYENCTMSGKTSGMGVTQKIEGKIADGVFYQKDPTTGITLYIFETDSGLRCVSNANYTGSGGMTGDFARDTIMEAVYRGYTSVGQIVSAELGDVDHSCFEKTKEGFTIKLSAFIASRAASIMETAENTMVEIYRQVIDSSYPEYSAQQKQDLIDEMMNLVDYRALWSEMFATAQGQYAISLTNGRICKWSFQMSMSTEVVGTIREEGEMTLSKFGKTKISVPAEIRALAEE